MKHDIKIKYSYRECFMCGGLNYGEKCYGDGDCKYYEEVEDGDDYVCRFSHYTDDIYEIKQVSSFYLRETPYDISLKIGSCDYSGCQIKHLEVDGKVLYKEATDEES